MCVRERERQSMCDRERDKESVCVCVRDRERVCVCVCVRQRVCVCETERECVRQRERECASVCLSPCLKVVIHHIPGVPVQRHVIKHHKLVSKTTVGNGFPETGVR